MNPTTHLTDEQMYELLDRTATPQAQAHLRECSACEGEVTSLRASLANFREAATQLAVAETPSLTSRRATSRSFMPRVWAASFATAAIALGISLAVLRPAHKDVTPKNVTAADAAQTAQTAESDDALLDGIQRDLSTSIPPSLEPLAVPAATGETSTQD